MWGYTIRLRKFSHINYPENYPDDSYKSFVLLNCIRFTYILIYQHINVTTVHNEIFMRKIVVKEISIHININITY